jgi:hypothetical protein
VLKFQAATLVLTLFVAMPPIDKAKKLIELFQKVITTTMTFKKTGRGKNKVTKCSISTKAKTSFSGRQM